jgi:regulatory factor X
MSEESKVDQAQRPTQAPNSQQLGLKQAPQHNNITSGPGPTSNTGTPIVNNYAQVPVIVAHYPSANGLQHFPFQQQVIQTQFYQQHGNPQHQSLQLQRQPQVQQNTPQLPHVGTPQPQVQAQYSTTTLPPQIPIGGALQHHHQDLGTAGAQGFQTPKRSLTGESGSQPGSARRSTSTTPESARKRQRKADHAFPGEDGDQELRNMAQKVLDIPLEQVAEQVKNAESQRDSSVSTPLPDGKVIHIKSDVVKERQRQIFGMTWLMRSCDASSKAVVPRNRIYARYVSICAENGLKPLSPASFGKLVRIVFPNLTTRRLGMRGQSKYHYCGLKLIGDDGNSAMTSSANTPLHNHSGLESSFLPGTPYGSNSPASYQSHVSTPLPSNSTTSTSVATITSFMNEHVSLELKFDPEILKLINEKSSELEGPIGLPDIKPYLPPNTDMDTADTLYGLYKSHCTSIFEAMRYVQINKLYALLTNFDASLTIPVLKLYCAPSMSSWIIASDTIMYQTIVKMLAKLALQEIPNAVLQQLKQVAQCYTEKLHISMKKMPEKLVRSRLIISRHFAHLISRLVRVSETGQSANNVLSHTLDRKLMHDDWVKNVDVEQIASKELPCDGDNFKRAVEVLRVKVPELLTKQDSEHESFINEWGLFIASLPEGFEGIPPRLFLLCTSALLTSALREISLAGGPGFGGWWVVRCWVDEWIGWCAELGGFLATPIEASPLLTGSSDLPVSHASVLADNDKSHETQPVDLLDGQFGALLTRPGANEITNNERNSAKAE